MTLAIVFALVLVVLGLSISSRSTIQSLIGVTVIYFAASAVGRPQPWLTVFFCVEALAFLVLLTRRLLSPQ